MAKAKFERTKPHVNIGITLNGGVTFMIFTRWVLVNHIQSLVCMELDWVICWMQ